MPVAQVHRLLTSRTNEAQPRRPWHSQFRSAFMHHFQLELNEVRWPTLDTAYAAHFLNRRPQPLRAWACHENGPIRPIRINGRLAWPVREIRRLLEDGVTSESEILPNFESGRGHSKGPSSPVSTAPTSQKLSLQKLQSKHSATLLCSSSEIGA